MRIKTYSPKISICIPVYNEVNKIRRSIESALAQTYNNVEVIVSDNASDDGTYEIVNQYGRDLVVLNSVLNAGLIANWNKVLAAATGDFVLILGADDYLHEQYVEELMSAYEEGVYFISGTTRYVYGDRIDSFLFEPAALEGLSEEKMIARMRSNEKVNLLIDGVFRKDVWEQMLPKKLKSYRGVSADRIVVMLAIIVSEGNYRLINTVPYFKDKSMPQYEKMADSLYGRVYWNRYIDIFVHGIRNAVSGFNPLPWIRSSVLFWKMLVMHKGLTMRKRANVLYYWLMWSITRWFAIGSAITASINMLWKLPETLNRVKNGGVG